MLHVADGWQVLDPPATVSLQMVAPVIDSQSIFDIQITEIYCFVLKEAKYNFYIPADKQIPRLEQNSPSPQGYIAVHVEGD